MTLGSARGRIDVRLVEACDSERQYLSNVLSRIVAVVKFLAERGLSFHGHDEIIGPPTNGNYLGVLELISQFAISCSTHRTTRGTRKGKISYLFSTICDEFIMIMGEGVLKRIVSELNSAKYFSVSIDSSPDMSHVDQLTCVVSYVLTDGPI